MLAVLIVNLVLRLAAGLWCSDLAYRSQDRRVAGIGAVVLLSAGKIALDLVRYWPAGKWTSGAGLAQLLDLVIGVACLHVVFSAQGVLIQENLQRALQIRRSETRAKRFAEMREDGVWTLDTEGYTTYANPALGNLLGIHPVELQGRPWIDAIPLDRQEEARVALDQLGLRRMVIEQIPLRSLHGVTHFVRMHLSQLEGEDGEREGFLIHVVDVTAQTLSAFGTQAKQQMFEQLTQGGELEAAVVSLTNRLEALLPGYTFRMQVSEAVDAPVVNRSHLEQGHWLEPLIGSAGEVHGSIEVRLPQRREPRAAELALGNAMAQLGGLLVERYRTREALDRTRRLLEATLEESQAGILVVDAKDHTIQLVNAAARELLQPVTGQRQRLKGRPLEDHYTRLDLRYPNGEPIASEDMPLMRSLLAGESCHDEQILIEHAGGETTWLLVNTAPLRTPDGQVEAAVAVFLDVTGREKANRTREQLLQQLAAQNDELEQVFRATSHDLRSPLVNIKGFNNEIRIAMEDLEKLLQAEVLDGPSRTEVNRILSSDLPDAIGFVHSSTEKMDRLLRALSQIPQQNSPEFVAVPVKVDSLVNRVLAELSFAIQTASAEVRVAPLPDCLGSEDELGQVFTNLVDNAIKYLSPERSGLVEITGTTIGSQVEYRVSDNGIGIDPRHHDKIFETFRRLDPTGSVPGEGLGLSILTRLVARHGGTCGVDSSPDEGSVFWVRLPACPALPVERPGLEKGNAGPSAEALGPAS